MQNSTTFAQYNQETINDMKNWLLDVFEAAQETVNEMSNTEVLRAITRYFEGGIQEFIVCNTSYSVL